MEIRQIEKKIDWLDKQRLKESEKQARLTEQVKAVEKAITKNSRQLKDLSSEITRQSALTTRIHQMDETLTKHRAEISRQLETAESRRSEKEKQIEGLHKIDQKEIMKSLDELKKEVSRINEIEQKMDTRQDEDLRIASTMNALQKRFDELDLKDEERSRSLAFIEEERKQESRRMADVQSDALDLRKKADHLRGEVESVEDRVRRLEVRSAELTSGEEERRELQDLWMENQGMKIVEFAHAWKEWEKRFNAFEERAVDLDERMQSYEETYRALTKMRSNLDELLERLERRISEVSEMQRLAEDRSKQAWSSFQADDLKRWNTFKLTNDEQWRDHGRTHDKSNSELQKLSESATAAVTSLTGISEESMQKLNDFSRLMREWAEEIERLTQEVG